MKGRIVRLTDDDKILGFTQKESEVGGWQVVVVRNELGGEPADIPVKVRSGLETEADADKILGWVEEHFEKHQINTIDDFDPILFRRDLKLNRFSHGFSSDTVNMAENTSWSSDDVFHHHTLKKSVSWNNLVTDASQFFSVRVNKNPEHPDFETIKIRTGESGKTQKGTTQKETLLELDRFTAKKLQKFLNESLG